MNLKKQSRGPMLLAISGIGFSVSLVLAVKYVYNPWIKTQKMDEAEQYANYLMENRKV